MLRSNSLRRCASDSTQTNYNQLSTQRSSSNTYLCLTMLRATSACVESSSALQRPTTPLMVTTVGEHRLKTNTTFFLLRELLNMVCNDKPPLLTYRHASCCSAFPPWNRCAPEATLTFLGPMVVQFVSSMHHKLILYSHKMYTPMFQVL